MFDNFHGNAPACDVLEQMIAGARIPHEDVVPFLLDELSRRSDDEITMCAILETLGKIGSPDSVRPLIAMLQNAGKYVEAAIAQTLLRIMSEKDVLSLSQSEKALLCGILEMHILDADDEHLQGMLAMLSTLGGAGSVERIVERFAQIRTAPESAVETV